jgi:hypothetical protein
MRSDFRNRNTLVEDDDLAGGCRIVLVSKPGTAVGALPGMGIRSGSWIGVKTGSSWRSDTGDGSVFPVLVAAPESDTLSISDTVSEGEFGESSVKTIVGEYNSRMFGSLLSSGTA